MVDLERIDKVQLFKLLQTCSPHYWASHERLEVAWSVASPDERAYVVVTAFKVSGHRREVRKAWAKAIRRVAGVRWASVNCTYSSDLTRMMREATVMEHWSCLHTVLYAPLLTWELALDLLELIDITRGLPMKEKE